MALQADKRCIGENCPNICHVLCLRREAEFRCGNTGQLRAEAGINHPVTFHRRDTQVASDPPALSPSSPSTPPAEEEDEDSLHSATKEELVYIVRSLKRELASVKSCLTNYRSITSELQDKRGVLVEALAIVDTLLATYDNEETQQRSIACTAKPQKIDSETEASDDTPLSTHPPPPSQDSSPSLSSSPSPSPQPTPEEAEELEPSPHPHGDTADSNSEERKSNTWPDQKR